VGIRRTSGNRCAVTERRREAPHALVKIVRKLTRIFYRVIDCGIGIVALDGFSGPERAADSNTGLSCREIGEADIARVAACFGADRTRNFGHRLRASKGFMVCEGSEPAGYLWCCRSVQEKEGFPPFYYAVRPKSDAVYITDFYVKPEKRGNGVGSGLLRHALSETAGSDATEAFLVFDTRSPAMRAITSKLGFRVVGKLSYRRYLWHESRDISDLSLVSETMENSPGE